MTSICQEEITRKWHGHWIKSSTNIIAEPVCPAPYLRKTFNCTRKPGNTVVCLCGLGWHELYVNGQKADDRFLAPLISQYDVSVNWIEYDVTRFVRKGENAIVVLLGNGVYNWVTPYSTMFSNQFNRWRDVPKMICDVVADGQVILSSNASWKIHPSPIIFDALREGERYDARLEIPGVLEPDFDDSAWENAKYALPPGGTPVRENAEPCRVRTEYKPIQVYHFSSCQYVYDFGTALSGWCTLDVEGPAGGTAEMCYAEILLDNHDIANGYLAWITPSGHDFQTDRYTLKGGEPETWHARFTYHGFRYMKLTLSPGVKVRSVTAQFICNSFADTGSFESSDPMLNALQTATRQAYLANFVNIPTDCPHREKIGWTGDANLAAETGSWNFAPWKGYANFIRLLTDSQRPSGQISVQVPASLWGWESSGPSYDVCLLELPWQVYRFTGDASLICRTYDAVRRYFNFAEAMTADGLIDICYPDWCPPDPNRCAPRELTSSCFLYYALILAARFSKITGHPEDLAYFREFADVVRKGINRKYYQGNGIYAGSEWTSLALPAAFGITEPEELQTVVANLDRAVRANDYKVDFGIYGAKYTPRVLAAHGFADTAYRLITQDEFPGWGYEIKMGATALWEMWSGNSSRCHIMFGDISAWMYEFLAGIHPDDTAPGFKHFRIEPSFVSGLGHVSASHISPYGTIRSEWKRQGEGILCRFVIPEGSTADIKAGENEFKNATGSMEFRVSSMNY